MNNRLTLTFLIIALTSFINAQFIKANYPPKGNYIDQINLDSLFNIWHDEKQEDTIRLKAIQRITKKAYLFTQPDSAFYFAQLQYEFAKKKGLKKFMSNALSLQGLSYYLRGDYYDAIHFYDRCLIIQEEINDLTGIANTLNNLGIIYNKYGSNAKAMEYYTRSLKIKEELGDKQGIASSLNNIGNIYSNMDSYSKAIEYYTRSLKIKEEINDKQGISNCLNNIGNIYSDWGYYDKALDYHNKSLNINKEIGDDHRFARSLNNIGLIYYKQKEYETAIDYGNRSLLLREEIGDKQGIASCLNSISNIYFDQGNYTKVINYSKRAMSIGKEIGGVKVTRDAAKILYETYEKTGNIQASFEMFKLYISLRESIKVQKNVIRQEIEYEYEKQALSDSIAFVQQITLDAMSRKTERYTFFAGFGLLLLILGVYLKIYSIRKNVEKKELLQEIDLYKMGAVKKNVSDISVEEQFQLDKEKIELAINSKLNKTDWNSLIALYNNPAISNQDLAEEISLSIGGTRSSLSKMYNLFEIKTSRNQRLALVMQAAKLSRKA
ncbi:MAG: tetratricopeptide repeat protein [bacterium]|nr:tetratricopeptide repeat protein [bacterium]